MGKSILVTLIILFISLSFSLQASAENKDWDKVDKAILSALISLNSLDCLQTKYIFDHPEEYHETNVLIKQGVDKFGKSFIPLYFAAYTLFNAWVADHLSFKYHRKIYLGVWSLSALGYVSNNMALDIGFSF